MKGFTVCLTGSHHSFCDEINFSLFLLNFILLYWEGVLQGQRVDMKGQGNEWDPDAWQKRHKEYVEKKV